MGLREIDSLLTMLILLLMTSVIGKHLCILVCLLFGEVWLGVRLAGILWFELSMFVELGLSLIHLLLPISLLVVADAFDL
jgi:hypothetical protein